MRKYRVFFVIIALVAVVSLFVFQMMDDGGLEPTDGDQPDQKAIIDVDAGDAAE